MKLSKRAKRMERHHKRSRQSSGINLVSLMDIFTILVFFLLFSSAEVQELPSTKSIKLPESVSNEKPPETLVILVDKDNIVVRGEKITTVSEVMLSESLVIDSIKTALEDVTKRSILASEKNSTEREVMIMGDRDLPYILLKKIMASCTEARYNNISLAVVKKNNMDG